MGSVELRGLLLDHLEAISKLETFCSDCQKLAEVLPRPSTALGRHSGSVAAARLRLAQLGF